MMMMMLQERQIERSQQKHWVQNRRFLVIY